MGKWKRETYCGEYAITLGGNCLARHRLSDVGVFGSFLANFMVFEEFFDKYVR